jgi:CBS domain containing-hemolysin-like protein
VVTFEDLVEELVGEVADESDRPADPAARRRRDGSWLLSGLLRPDEVTALAEVFVPEGHYETIGGLVQTALGRIPRVADVVELPRTASLRVQRMDGPAGRPRRPRATARHAGRGESAMSTPVALLLGVLLIAGNGFFVAAEFAVLAARQTKLTGLAETSRRAPLGAARGSAAAADDLRLPVRHHHGQSTAAGIPPA